MNKKYLMRGFAALALVAGFSSCVKDVDGISPAEEAEKAKENAELQLGLNIPDGQTWDMSQQIAANVTVDLNADETYTVGICDKNPLNFEDAKYYALKKVEGGKISATFTAPIAKSDYYVIAYNSKYQAIVNKVEASNGVINANVSYTSGASGTMRGASNRAIDPAFDFADAPEDNEFVTLMPTENIFEWSESEYGQGESMKNFKFNSTDYQYVKPYNGNATFYMDGTHSIEFVNPGDGANNFYFYILPNANITFNENFALQKPTNFKMYVAANATVTFAKGLNANVKLYNRGTVIVEGTVENGVYGSGMYYNEGTMKFVSTFKKKIAGIKYQDAWNIAAWGETPAALVIHNAESQIVNAGTLETNGLVVEGSGHFLNLNKTTVTGYTVVNSNNCTWVNDGEYTTDYFSYTAGSTDVVNNCKLTVNEMFHMMLGDTDKNCFRMDANSSVVTKDFHIGIGYIKMASNSLFNVTNQAIMDCRKSDYGIYNVSTDNGWSVFKAKDVVAGWQNQGYLVTYGGNLAVVCETHFANGKSGDYPYIDFKGNASIFKGGNFSEGKAGSVAPDMETITASLCNPGFDPGEGDGDEFYPEPAVYTYAFEDQKVNGDYDMNDVVLKISYHAVRDEQGRITEIQEDKLDVKMVAAGATFNIKVYLGQRDANGKPIENPVALFGDQEIHAAFGVSEGVMVNTGRNNANVVTLTGVTPPTGWNGDIKNLDIWIWVNPGSGSASETQIFYLTDKEKPVPYAIMIPNDWRWPTERTCVTEAYPGKNTANAGEPVVFDDEYSFRKWAETPNDDRTDAMKSWFNYYLKGKTMTNASTNSND